MSHHPGSAMQVGGHLRQVRPASLPRLASARCLRMPEKAGAREGSCSRARVRRGSDGVELRMKNACVLQHTPVKVLPVKALVACEDTA